MLVLWVEPLQGEPFVMASNEVQPRAVAEFAQGKIRGSCPMGCGDTLFIGTGGYITCSWIRCPNPGAAGDILLEHTDHRHIVRVDTFDYSIQHPLHERLNGELFECPLDAFMRALSGPPRKPGRYVVGGGPDNWTWYEAPVS